jgi:membrane dipeptidase
MTNLRNTVLGLLLATLFTACGKPDAPDTPSASAVPDAAANRIAAGSIIVDTHIDVPYRLADTPADVTVATDDGDFDYPRARAGHLNAAFMSIYTPAELEAEGRSFEVANELIDGVEDIVSRAPDKFAIATSVADVRAHFDSGLISLPLGMENGSPLEGDFGKLRHFYDRGIRYITLAHSLSNHISDSSYDENRQWGGLSEFGSELVAEMNRLGVMIDVSHLSDDAFDQVMDLSRVPVIASHSSARHFTPGWERNMSDAMIRRLAEQGGVIMINFGSAFLKDGARQYSERRREALREAREASPDIDEHELEQSVLPGFEAENGAYPYATLDDVLDHIDHVVALAGVDAVGLGSDFDGVGDSLPEGLKDVSGYPVLVAGLLERGYSEGDIRKILGENLLRVWSAVEEFALDAAS